MSGVAVRIFHPEPGPGAGPLERSLAEARLALARRHEAAFREAGARDASIVAGTPDGRPFGARLRDLVSTERPAGVVVLGSGGLALATVADLRRFVEVAAAGRRKALANNRYSADATAVSCAESLLDLPDLPADNGLPRWLEEVADYEVRDLASRWRLQVDLDSPLDVALVAGDERFAWVAGVAADRRAEILVAGRTSAGTMRWLERNVAARVRMLAEERGLKTSTAGQRRPRSVLGLVLDREGPDAFGSVVADLADAAIVDSRVLLAHRFGADEAGWPSAEDRFGSDLLLPELITDPWLRALTESARDAPIPVVLGGHTLVGPGLRLALRRRGR